MLVMRGYGQSQSIITRGIGFTGIVPPVLVELPAYTDVPERWVPYVPFRGRSVVTEELLRVLAVLYDDDESLIVLA